MTRGARTGTMAAMTLSLHEVPGVPECTLPTDLRHTLPPNRAPAPWTVAARAVVWFARATPEANDALPPALRARGRAAVVIGGLVRYADTPVGAYDEVFAAIGMRVGRHLIGTIPFMSVDSPTSLVGGRDNWSIPKTLSTFTGAPTEERFASTSATDREWSVTTSIRASGPRLPVFSRLRVIQQFPDGSLQGTRLKANGRMRLADIEVDVQSDGPLADWMVPGRRRGAVLERTAFTLGAPQPF